MGFRVLNNSLASYPVVGLRGGFDNRQDFIFIKADNPRQNCKLHDVDTTLAAFETCHKRLVAFELRRQLLLAETRILESVMNFVYLGWPMRVSDTVTR